MGQKYTRQTPDIDLPGRIVLNVHFPCFFAPFIKKPASLLFWMHYFKTFRFEDKSILKNSNWKDSIFVDQALDSLNINVAKFNWGNKFVGHPDWREIQIG